MERERERGRRGSTNDLRSCEFTKPTPCPEGIPGKNPVWRSSHKSGWKPLLSSDPSYLPKIHHLNSLLSSTRYCPRLSQDFSFLNFFHLGEVFFASENFLVEVLCSSCILWALLLGNFRVLLLCNFSGLFLCNLWALMLCIQ